MKIKDLKPWFSETERVDWVIALMLLAAVIVPTLAFIG